VRSDRIRYSRMNFEPMREPHGALGYPAALHREGK
jgi:hypothetical protein